MHEPIKRNRHMYRRSDSISTRPYVQNNLTCQYADTNDAHRDLTPRPRHMEFFLDTVQIYAMFMSTSSVQESPPTPLSPWALRCHVSSRRLPDASAIIIIGSSALAVVYKLIWLTVSHWTRLTKTYGFQFYSNYSFQFDLTHCFSFNSTQI